MKDPLYRALCEDSQKTWKERNPDYLKQHRASQRDAGFVRPVIRPAVRELEQLLSNVKNNLEKNTSAFRVKRCAPGIWLVALRSPAADKNIPLQTQVVMIQGITPEEPECCTKEQRSGNPGGSAV